MVVTLLIENFGIGGAQRVSLNLICSLHEAGISTNVIIIGNNYSDFYPLPFSTSRIALNLSGETSGIGKLTANWSRVRALRRVLRETRPDLVVGMMPTSTILAILATRGLGIKVVGSERNFPGRRMLGRPWSLARKLLYRFADGHVAQTRKEAAWLEWHAGARNVTVIPNAVAWPLPAYEPRRDPQAFIAPQRRLLLAVGTKPAQKGFDLLIPAFAELASRHPDWDLAIIGVTPDEELARLAEAHGVASRIVLPGRVGNIGDWYERADLFVLSSRYEGFPNALLEAMASGCACVSFDCDTGPRDIITHGENGLLAPPENAAGLREALDRLMCDDVRRATFAERAPAVRETFSPENIYGRWLAFLESV